MKKFSPLTYIRKYQYLIIAVSLLAGVAFYLFFAGKRTYTVSAIIEYTNADASVGKSPDGRDIDTSEIYSVPVMQEVFNRMGMSYDSHNLDKLRSRVVVTPIQTEEEQAIREAQNDQGEVSEMKPTKYIVSFTASHDDSGDPANFARQVLDNLLDAYLAEYAENHINGSTVVNNISRLTEGNYDYLEMIEMIESDVDNTLLSLSGRAQNSTYRSAATGYSFMDLYRDFDVIFQTEIPNVYAYILNNKVSRDTSVLLSKYRNRIENYNISNSASGSELEAINSIIEAYVRMMRESGNTNITYEYILSDVDDDYYRNQEDEQWTKPDETVKYDVLLEDYVANHTKVAHTAIDIAYCQYIIDIFSGVSDTGDAIDVPVSGTPEEGEAPADGQPEGTEGETNGEESAVLPLTGEEPLDSGKDTVSAEEAAANVETMLSGLIARLDRLYQIMDQTNEEYNEFAGASNITLGSNVVLGQGMQLMLYTGIVIVLFAILLSIATAVLGRVWEIFYYHLYVDQKFKLPNRAACDRYINGYARRILPEHMACISVMAEDVKKKNELYGLAACDGMLKKLIEFIQTAFEGVDNKFVSINGLGQFIVFAGETSYDQAQSCMQYLANLTEDYNQEAECRISYRFGIAETKEDSIYSIRTLMIKAITRSANAGTVRKKETEREKGRSEKDKKLDDLLIRLEGMRKNG